MDPWKHAATASLRQEAASFQLSSHISDCSVSGESGLVHLTIQAGNTEGYGYQPWVVLVGGAAFGDDDEETSVCVRFRDPISMSDVDDTGVVHGLLPRDQGSAPTLALISSALVALLHGELHAEPAERARAFRLQEEHCLRKLQVVETFRSQLALCPEIVARGATVRPEWLADEVLRRRLESGAGGTGPLKADVCTEVSPGVFTFDLFTPVFCDQLLAEMERFEASDLPRRRPNTMNKGGLVVNEAGWLGLVNDLLARIVAPLARECFPEEAFSRKGAGLDCHHSFVVQYKARGLGSGGGGGLESDEGLDMHHDSSEVTLNVCLGRGDFSYAGLVFCGHSGRPDVRHHQYSHAQPKGQAVLHLGRHRHGAGKITRGERVNLIVWARNATFRAAAAAAVVAPDGWPKEGEDLAGVGRVCLSATNDADYAQRLAELAAV